jgi:hypothetical protein
MYCSAGDSALQVAMALIVVSRLVNSETLPALLPLVIRCLEHTQVSRGIWNADFGFVGPS